MGRVSDNGDHRSVPGVLSECGVKIEKVPQLPSKAPFSQRFEEAVGLACESASVRQVARQFRTGSQHGAGDRPAVSEALECRASQGAVREMGVDEIYFGKQMKFITVVSNLETGEPLWFGQDRKQETLDGFFRTQLNATAAETNRGGVRGYVAAIHQQH